MRQCLVCGGIFLTPATRGRPPETCSPEHAAIRKREQRIESRDKAIQRGIPDDHDAHGTSTGYTYYCCRCNRCRRWAREYKQAQREAQKDFGLSEAYLHRWLKIADREDGRCQPASPTDSDKLAVQLRDAHTQIRLLEQEAEVMRRAVGYLPQDAAPK